jgi:hypothetical protein
MEQSATSVSRSNDRTQSSPPYMDTAAGWLTPCAGDDFSLRLLCRDATGGPPLRLVADRQVLR